MKKLLLTGAACSVLLLAGCGDGWEMRPYDNTPYGDRTAGRGVEYVRANMMKEKGPLLEEITPMEEPVLQLEPEEPVAEPLTPEPPSPPEITPADSILKKTIEK